MNEFTLDDLNKALQAKYKPFVFTAGRNKFVLQQVLALPKEQRDHVRALLENLDNNKSDLDEDGVLSILKAVLDYVVDGDKSDKLVEALDHDLVKISVLFEAWTASSQVGEA